ncbi:MAG: glycosyltransferase family 39 protein, partial [Chloroflexi bacterium]|nr:glycosyltransferase family 39 protein [Chloroflexota bacterium]
MALGFIALLVRVAYTFVLVGPTATTDTALYWQHAQAVLKIGDYGPADYPPGYPYMLAGLGRPFGGITLDLAAAYGVLLSTITCVLVYLLGRELFDERVGWLSGWYTVFYYPLVDYSRYITTETQFTFLLVMAGVLLSLRTARAGWARMFVGGIVFGLAALTRETILPAILFVFVLGLTR